MTLKQKGYLAAALLGTLIVTGTLFQHSRDNEPLTLGFVAGISGKFADLGIDCRRGAEVAVKRINESGGINGRQMVLLASDDKQDEEEARKIVQSFLDRKMPIIIGHATSSMTMATLPMVNATSTLLISPTTSTPLLKDIDDNFIRTCAISTDAAIMMAKYLLTVKGVKRAAVIYDTSNSAYTQQWYENFKKTFLALGGEEIVSATFMSAPDLEMLPLINDMKEKSPDGLVLVTNSVDGALLSQQVRKIGWQVPVALSDWAATEQLIALGGEAVEGAVISQFFNRTSTRPAYLDFKREFEQTYKTEPGFAAQHAYNAIMMVARGLNEKKGSETLKESIVRISTFHGLQGDFSINSFGDSSNPTFMGVIKDGTFVILEDFK